MFFLLHWIFFEGDFSIEGNDKDTYRTSKLTKVSLSKSNKTDSSKLLTGKLLYSNTTTKVTNTPGSTTTTTQQVSGWTKLYTARTDENGEFRIKLKLEGIEEKDYIAKCTFPPIANLKFPLLSAIVK